jgi:GLPGLI family protein
MLKKLNSYLFIFFLYQGILFSQNSFVATYRVTSIDTAAVSMLKKVMKNHVTEVDTAYIKSNPLVLKFNEKRGKWNKNEFEGNVSRYLQMPLFGSAKDFFYDIENNKVYSYGNDFYSQNLYILERDFNDKWVLVNETKYIGDYKCYKAEYKTLETIYTVWYCPDIPYSVGPFGFMGLPGFIIRYEDSSKIVTLESLKESKEILKIELPNDYKIITEKEFYEITKKSSEKAKVLLERGKIKF